MSDSQRFPVACHVLGYLAHRAAQGPGSAVPSAVLASSIGTNPVVVRRVTAQLAAAGLIATRTGATGGAWLLRSPDEIGLDSVLRAVNGCAHLGIPPPGNADCPMGQHIPKVVAKAISAADAAAAGALSQVSVADLIRGG
ncbi:MAG: Rrf2 family transcriptional regulator [Acetobacteraceae bacterium]|nr:Rrf2 family transcriptional regulator [Acetobacteraceae bacterium]